MSKKALIFLLIALISFVFTFAYVIFTKSQANNSPYYQISSNRFNDITTITYKESWRQLATANLLANNKVNGIFIAKTDNLGIISIPFDTHNKSINDKIIFKLKEAGKKDWYYQATYDAHQIQNNIPFPFGFPIIKSSQNKSYIIEIESLNGNSDEHLSLSKNVPYFFTKYKYSGSELLKDPMELFQFLLYKGLEQFLLMSAKEILIILLFSLCVPFLIFKTLQSSKDGFRELLFKAATKYKNELISRIELEKNEYRKILLGFLITVSTISFILVLTGLFSRPLTGINKWIPYISILLPFLLFAFNILKAKYMYNGYILILFGFLSSVITTFGILNYDRWLGPSGVILIVIILVIIPIFRYFSFPFIATLIFLFGINALVFINGIGWGGLIWSIPITILILSAFIYTIFDQTDANWLRKNKIIFIFLILISLALSLRSDSLFTGSGEFHWNYYTGVIQTIRSGGELLWSAPSQYGFLSVLLSSFLPWTSRNSFFILQSSLFLICFFIILKTIFLGLKNNKAFIIIGFSFLSLFFFADPSLIGPGLYPSSSAMRFLWIYVLLFTILLTYLKGNLQKIRNQWSIQFAYIAGLLWSAESAIYLTAIYTIYILFTAFSIFKSKSKDYAVRFLLINTLIIIAALIVFNIVYILLTHDLPDWSMFFMFALDYAGGFGELPIAPWGIHWSVIAILAALLFIAWKLYTEKKYNDWVLISVCFISLWALGSYYVGRAVVNNITAMLPIISYIFVIALFALKDKQYFTYRVLLYSVFLPWILIGVVGGIGNPQFIDKIQQFKFAEDINSKSFMPDNDLRIVLQEVSALNYSKIVYYGNPYNNPVIYTNGEYKELTAGLPIPSTLLEYPISQEKRNVIIRRFLQKSGFPIYFIYRKDEALTRMSDWKKFLNENYIMNKYFETDKYVVLKINKK